MELGQELPITGVCIVADPSRCPPNYTLIDKTFDRPEDADLWRDSFFGRRVMRYICVQRQIPSQSQDVLVDVTLIVEKDLPPPGFSVIDLTQDSKEKATQKRCLCVRWMVPSMTKDAITELILLTRAQRRAPAGYTLVGELNSMNLCYKMGNIPKSQNSEQTVLKPAQQGTIAPSYNLAPLNSSLPYDVAPAVPARSLSGGQSTMTRTGPPEQSANSLATGHINPISGAEWKMNPKYKQLLELQNLYVPDIVGKTLMDIERQYEYDFSMERSVSKAQSLS
uniref:Multivesicular body subunit 12A n=1 Tax=Arion vulgaris TaxID=1028688 RepID=A0A0B7ANP3_9EUPU